MCYVYDFSIIFCSQTHSYIRYLKIITMSCTLYQPITPFSMTWVISPVWCTLAAHPLQHCVPSGRSCVPLPQQHGTRISGERSGSGRWLAQAPTISVESQTGYSSLQTENSRRLCLRRRCTSESGTTYLSTSPPHGSTCLQSTMRARTLPTDS